MLYWQILASVLWWLACVGGLVLVVIMLARIDKRLKRIARALDELGCDDL